MEALLNQIQDSVTAEHLVITFAAGIAIPYRNITQVSGGSVKITAISGQITTFANSSWQVVTVSGFDHVNGGGLATFSLQRLIAYLKSVGTSSGSITITITGTGTDSSGQTWSFEAITSATVNPGAPPSH